MTKNINIIGAGLAGCEAALQLANAGFKVNLYEMKPSEYSPAHKLKDFAELVCSNSLKSMEPHNAHGLLKQELLKLNSYLIKTAFEMKIPGGKALTVDRIQFAKKITELLSTNKNIKIINQRVDEIFEDEINIIAAGPLITHTLFNNLKKYTGEDTLFFFDAIAPIIYYESIDFNNEAIILGNRYGEFDEGDYINILLNKAQYSEFYNDLINAELHNPADFEKDKFFEGCMPIEELAKRGFDTLRFGPMKPVGFHYKDGGRPFAVVQLRREDAANTLYNFVGFQTRLKYGEQERILKKLPGLTNIEFARKGSMHRNSYINSPKCLTQFLNLKNHNNIFICGQLCGVEGYVESIATGLVAALNCGNFINYGKYLELPDCTIIKSLINYITNPVNAKKFQPMNANFGILPQLSIPEKNKKKRYELYAQRSLEALDNFKIQYAKLS
ncbi:MAG TPA: methylenetetrahydrofolate--tRNA-(uracil(54)-C(5))-methyltransferase (FADH(2)-oxidizing) TrmFO [bacterium]|nr:methylenetetrahydrofolate--tRNA-(uracil(54)-C(5))-methyltransferase (FADH(2)-oxidizing) TrmFO [bacterium]